MKIINFIRSHKFLTSMIGIFILVNIYRFFSLSLNLDILELFIFAVLSIVLLILIVVSVVYSIITFRRDKLSAILTPIVAIFSAYCFICFPTRPLYVKLNHQIHLKERYAFMEAVQDGEITLTANGRMYAQLPPDLPEKYRGVSNRDYIIVNAGKTEYQFIISDGILGEYTAIMYGDPYGDPSLDSRHEPVALGNGWYYVVGS